VTDGRDLTRRDTLVLGAGALASIAMRPAAAQDSPERHGMSAFGDLKYPADFKHFEYVDPNVPKGGLFSQVGRSGSTIKTSSRSIRSIATFSRAMARRAWSSPSPA